MGEFNADDFDAEDDADGEHMAQIYGATDSFKDHMENSKASYVNLRAAEPAKAVNFSFGGLLESQQALK